MATIDLVRPTLRVREAAVLLGVAHETAYQAIRRGELRATRLGRRLSVPVVEVERLLGTQLDAEKLEWAKAEVDKQLAVRKGQLL